MAVVAVEIEEVQKALSGTRKSLKSIQRQVLGTIARGTVKAIKASIQGSDLQKRTGELLKAYRYKVKKSGNEANVFPKALNSDSSIFPKAMTLSYGHSGKTKRAENWEIKPRGFVQDGNKYAESGNYTDDLNKLIEKELKKYWG